MGRDKRIRSSSSESYESDGSYDRANSFRRRDERRPSSRLINSAESDGEKRFSDKYYQSRLHNVPSRENRNSDRDESRSNPNQDGSRNESVNDVDTRLQRLECMLETLMKRSDGSRGDRIIKYNVKADCIPEFHPEQSNASATKWLGKIDQLGEINLWDNKTKIYYMQNRLSGLAKAWYGNLNSYDRSWDEWKSLLIRSFPEHHDFATTLKRLVNRIKRPNESMTEYYFAKMNLLQTCKITGKDAVSCLIDGIQDATVQTGAKAGRYSSPEELFSEFLSAVSVNEKRHENYERKIIKKQRSNDVHYNKTDFKNDNTKSVKCFNCNEKGHVSTKCNKPKVECTNCKRLGHDAKNCLRQNKTTVNVVDKIFENKNKNNKKLKGFIDTGCSVVILKESEARSLKLEIDPCLTIIKGYGGGVVKTVGKVNIKLKVDLAECDIEALVVTDEIQSVKILIGQTFINNERVSMVIQGNKVRVFEKENVSLPQIDALPPAKVALWAKAESVIPPNSIGFINAESAVEEDIYIEKQHRAIPYNEYWINRCLTKGRKAFINIVNLSNHPLIFKKSQIVTRGIICKEEIIENDSQQTAFKTEAIKLRPFILQDIEKQIDEKLEIGARTRLLNLLNQYRMCFAQNIRELGKSEINKMEIKLKTDEPVVYKAYRMSYSERETVRNIVNELLENQIIRESNSAYSSPILLVKKKTGEYRMCVDYRKLNSNTIKESFPIPRIDDQIERLKGCGYFTTLDLANGYHQIPVSQGSIEKTAFITPDGHYEYLRMPFGLANAPAVFEKTINAVLGSLRFDTALAYMDGILIPTNNIEKGCENLELVLKRLKNSNLTLKLEKCYFFKQNIDYLGYEISSEGVQPGKRKMAAVENFPKPENIHNIRQFLGLASYFRKFIQDFSSIALPLTKMLRKNEQFKWEEPQESAFRILKGKLSDRPLLALYDPLAKTELHTDASKFGLGGILLQEQLDSKLKPISYFSRTTSKEEQKYHSYELETLAVVCSLKYFRVYLLGAEFRVVTDCNALRSAFSKKDMIPRIGRWWLSVQEYNFTVEYRGGKKMVHVDALSRNPVESDEVQVLAIDITTDDWVLTAQMQDEKCKSIIEVLSRKPEDENEKRMHKEYSLKNNRLYRNTVEGKRWVVPTNTRKEIVMCHHDNIGHFSVEKTVQNILKKYWFASMRKYVKNYISRCLGCLYNKAPSGKVPGYMNSIEKVAMPMHTLHIDHLGPFVESSRGNTHLIVVVDGFTKFVFMKAVANTKVGPVIKTLDEVINTFGVPSRIICDRGSCFTSEKFTEYCKSLGMKRVLNATSTPRTNGQVERYNRTILNSLTSSCEDERKWDTVLSSIRWGLNVTTNKSTGKSPYEILLGYTPRSPNDSFLANEVCENEQKELQKVREEAASSIKHHQEIQKKNFDRRRAKPQKYKIGQLVLVKRPKGSNDGASRKLLPKYNGPYVVTKNLKFDRYVIEDLEGSTRSRKKYKGICAADKLKLYRVHTEEERKLEHNSQNNKMLIF